MRGLLVSGATTLVVAFAACGGDGGNNPGSGGGDGGALDGGSSGGPNPPTSESVPPGGDGGPTQPPVATCASAGGSATVAAPSLAFTLKDNGEESWLASPGIADVDHDGKPDIVVARGGQVWAWKNDGTKIFSFDTGKDRIWASPAIGQFVGDDKLETAVAARDSVWLLDATGAPLPGFPATFNTEMRTLAAGDVDGDGVLDVVGGAKKSSDVDIVKAWKANGTAVAGFPPVAAGVAGCTPGPCYFAGLYDQNVAIGDLDGDGKQDLVLPHDDAYASFFEGTGVAFDSNPFFVGRTKTPGVRYLFDYAEAKQGYANDESTANQAHFTNTPPAIADINGDKQYDVVMLGSVQNAAQTDRLRGVGLWVMNKDASRVAGWEAPFHAPDYVVGLTDGFGHFLDDPPLPGADNLVAATNQVTIAEIDPKPGLEMIFAGFDGKIHAVAADKTELWSTPYATDGKALTGGVLVADLSGDGAPEIVFATYSFNQGGGALFILSSKGDVLQKVPLPHRGAMAVPAIGDVKGDGSLAIVVSLKDAEPGNASVQVYTVPGGKPNCLLWPTGRANLLRNAWVR